jgi:hypothetical protein
MPNLTFLLSVVVEPQRDHTPNLGDWMSEFRRRGPSSENGNTKRDSDMINMFISYSAPLPNFAD